MNDFNMVPVIAAVVEELPAIAYTKSGVAFNPRSNRWVYREGLTTVSLNFSNIINISAALLTNLKKTLLWYAANYADNTLKSVFERAIHFLNFAAATSKVSLDTISAVDIMNYRGALSTNKAWYLGKLRPLLFKWAELGNGGVENNVIHFLKKIKIPGNKKGHHVLTRDPEKGPFTDIERLGIQHALSIALLKGEISIEDHLMCWLFMLFGQRPIQYAGLKICDLSKIKLDEGSESYLLKIPRAKQGRLMRVSFKARSLDPQFGRVLWKYAKALEARMVGIIDDPQQAPLFPESQSRNLTPQNFKLHRTSSGIRNRLVQVLNELQVVSERTGQVMHIEATRFRRTIGTNAAAEGHGALVIAELLDHSDTQNVQVYVEATPKLISRIDLAVAKKMAPLAQAFAGVLVKSERDALRGEDPSSRIVSPERTDSFKPVGTCGKHGFCGFLAPIACYTCINFQAWLDGPHEAVLESLISERENLLNTTDKRVAAINDRTILAVAQVVEQCKVRREERQQ